MDPVSPSDTTVDFVREIADGCTMTLSDKIDVLVSEMREHEIKASQIEARMAQIKHELAVLLGLAPMEDAPDVPDVPVGGPVAEGTLGRQCLEAIAGLVGEARVPLIAQKMFGEADKETKVRVRSYVSYLAKNEFIERTDERGVWRPTGKGMAVLRNG